MSWKYLVEVMEPHTHLVKVTLSGKKNPAEDRLRVFLPSWSPGSYLMREYSRNILTFKAQGLNGEELFYKKIEKGVWEIDWSLSELSKKSDQFSISYQIYCHELTVRTSHVDNSHAFLHGPSYLMGIENRPMKDLTIEFRFTALWSKLSTALDDISEDRKKFIYRAENYDVLIDTPVEIGCQETDGFMVSGKEHHLAWFGQSSIDLSDLKKDIKTIVEHVSKTMKDIPYQNRYLFITHLVPDLFGGLEHVNSTALQFDGRRLNNRKDYLAWLSLVAHEYFHTWNVKRIRPLELGPFEYTKENYTTMLWLAEGLTSFVDELFVLRSELCSLEEYLGMQLKNLQRYYSIPGKKFHSLEQSSFDAWIKLYRPDENTLNSTISYYLKGGIAFNLLHFMLHAQGKSVFDLVDKLWQSYQERPEQGVDTEEVLAMIEELSDRKTRDEFWRMIATTEDLDIESAYQAIGVEFVWSQEEKPYLGASLQNKNGNVFVKNIVLDGPANKAGLNAGDEVIALNGQRFKTSDIDKLDQYLTVGKKVSLTVSRLGQLQNLELIVAKAPRELKELKVVDKDKALKALTA